MVMLYIHLRTALAALIVRLFFNHTLILLKSSSSLGFEEVFRIRQALAYWEELTCITFAEIPNAEHKLLFVRGKGFVILVFVYK